MLGAVVSEAVVFGLVSQHFELTVVVLRVKGVEAVCLTSDVSGIAVIFCVVTLAPLLEVDLQGELERADVVVLDVSALN